MTDLKTVLNVMATVLMLPATIFMVYGMIREKMRHNRIPGEIMTVGLLYALVWVSLIRMNLGAGFRWVGILLLALELALIVYLFRRLWRSRKIIPAPDKGGNGV